MGKHFENNENAICILCDVHKCTFCKEVFFSQFHPFVNDFLDFSKLTKSLYYQLLGVKGDSDTEKGGSVSSFEGVRVMHVLKKKDWSCIAVGFIRVSV